MGISSFFTWDWEKVSQITAKHTTTVSRLQSHYEETVYFLPFNSQVSRGSWYSIDWIRKNERLCWPWSTTQWFWPWDPWIGNPAPSPLGHCMFQLATMGRRNHFHIFLSLAVNCENKLLKVYCNPRL